MQIGWVLIGVCVSETIIITIIRYRTLPSPHTVLIPLCSVLLNKCFWKNIVQILYFWSSFKVHNKTERKIQRFSVTPCPRPVHSLPHYRHPLCPQRGTFVAIDESTLAYHSHSKSIVYVRFHSWCYTFSGFEQMCNDMCPSLWCP